MFSTLMLYHHITEGQHTVVSFAFLLFILDPKDEILRYKFKWISTRSVWGELQSSDKWNQELNKWKGIFHDHG